MAILSIWLIVAAFLFLTDLFVMWVNDDMATYKFWSTVGFCLSWPLILLTIIIAMAAILFSSDKQRT